MTKPRDIRSFDYVNHPYDQVRDALKADAVQIFRDATKAASSRAEDVAAELFVKLGDLEIGADIEIAVDRIEEHPRSVAKPETTVLDLHWKASKTPRLFPFMKAQLSVYPLTGKETQLDFAGHYEPPLGALGSAIDAAGMHRVAEASIHRFLKDIARYLRENLRG